ncbi:hypothetical protein M885DRAFT_551093 [Pelagophyceae sp. CCMP2097]|nr:hypothetical protein M885DRAFT_551093 [Pelagophyceae sp. CCMP2097]
MRVKWEGAPYEGFVSLIAEESDDLWTLYNLVDPGDKVRSSCSRKVAAGDAKKGDADSTKKRVTLTLRVVSSEYDAVSDSLRIAGVNAAENALVKVGAHQTTEVGLHAALRLSKEEWTAPQRAALDKSADARQSSALAVLLVDGALGAGRLFVLTAALVRQVAAVDVAMPKNCRAAYGDHRVAGAVERFHDHLLDALAAKIDWAVTKDLVVSGPGAARTAFCAWAAANKRWPAGAEHLRRLATADGGLVDVPGAQGTSGDAVRALLEAPAFQAKLAQSSAAEFVDTLQALVSCERRDAARVLYGSVTAIETAAVERNALDLLLVLDDRLKTTDVAAKRRLLAILAAAKATGSTVVIFPSRHVAAESLVKLGGIAATLRFPCPDLADVVDVVDVAPAADAGDATAAEAPRPPAAPHIEKKVAPKAKAKPQAAKAKKPALNTGGGDDDYYDGYDY